MNRERSDSSVDPPQTPQPPLLQPQRSLFTNTVFAVMGTGFFHGCQLGIVMLLNKFASPDVTGQYFFALAVATPVVLLFGLELRGALVADAGGQFSVGAYHALRGRAMLAAAVVLAGVAAWRAVVEPQTAFVLILVGVFAARLAWGVAEVGWGTYQRRERLDLFAVSYVLRGVVSLGPFAILLPYFAWYRRAGGETVAWATGTAVLLYAAGFFLVYVLFDRPRVLSRAHWDVSWDWGVLRRLVVQTFPLGLVALSINLCDSFPRWLFESELVPNGRAQLGYFGSLAYITLAGNLIIIQAATAAANRLALYYQRDLRAFLRLGSGLTVLALAVGSVVLVLAVVFGRWFLSVLYTPDYVQFEREFLIIVGAHCLALLTNIFGATTTQMRLFWIQVPVQVITLGATVTAAVLLIPGETPVLGGALTLAVRAVVQFVLYTLCMAGGVVFRERILEQRARLVGSPSE